MYSDQIMESLEIHKRLAETLTGEEIKELTKGFENHVAEFDEYWNYNPNFENPWHSNYLSNNISFIDLELGKAKAIILTQDIIQRSLEKAPSSF